MATPPAIDATTAIVKSVDMADEMQQDVINLAAEAMAKYELEKDIAMHCKKELDRKFSTTWHVVVGKNFVTHETKHFIYFYIGQFAFLMWKTS